MQINGATALVTGANRGLGRHSLESSATAEPRCTPQRATQTRWTSPA